jgi:glycosyltransferase involved in cell wall biosynthesis
MSCALRSRLFTGAQSILHRSGGFYNKIALPCGTFRPAGSRAGTGVKERSVRIAFLGDGSLGHVRRWAKYFHDQGHETLLLSFESVEGCLVPARRLRSRFPTKLLGYLSALGDIRKELAHFRPDIVNALYLGGYGFVAARSGVHPLVVSSLGSDLLVDYPSSPVHRLQIRHVLRQADLILTDADELSRIAISAGASPGKILKTYMGIDESVFFPRRSAPDGKRPGGGARVVSTRNLFPVYNVDMLVDAAPLIRAKLDAHFVVCGDGPDRARLEAKVKQLSLERSFIFKGRLDPVGIARELRAADVYVSTSRSDSTSVSLLEAMACGAVPVVTDLPANREWIRDGENGRIARNGDAASLAEAVVETLLNPVFMTVARESNLLVVNERGLWKTNMRRVEEAFMALKSRALRWSEE